MLKIFAAFFRKDYYRKDYYFREQLIGFSHSNRLKSVSKTIFLTGVVTPISAP